MKMNSQFTITTTISGLLAALIACSACSVKTTSSKDLEPTNRDQAPVMDLTGTWQAACHSSQTPGEIDTVSFHGNAFAEEVDYYGDGQCSGPATSVKFQGTYSVGDTALYDDSARNLDLQIVDQSGKTQIAHSIVTITGTQMGDHLYLPNKNAAVSANRPASLDRTTPFYKVAN